MRPYPHFIAQGFVAIGLAGLVFSFTGSAVSAFLVALLVVAL